MESTIAEAITRFPATAGTSATPPPGSGEYQSISPVTASQDTIPPSFKSPSHRVPKKTLPSATTGELTATIPGTDVDQASSRGGSTGLAVKLDPAEHFRNIGQSSSVKRTIGVTVPFSKARAIEMGVPSENVPVTFSVYCPSERLEMSRRARHKEMPSCARGVEGTVPPGPETEAEIEETREDVS
jgi:hypothetical protein